MNEGMEYVASYSSMINEELYIGSYTTGQQLYGTRSEERPYRASDLIARLQQLMAEHGDCLIFSEADWTIVQEVRFCPAGEHIAEEESEPYFILSY